jgi:competence protein ComEC
MVLLVIVNFIPKGLKVYFIDVGQGDSTLIKTPMNNTILIDGGGSINSEFDVGKNTLIPYLLARNVNQLDYIMISHYDYDHVGGILTVLSELKVKNVIIAKQYESTSQFEEFKKLVEEKNINVIVVKAGQRVNIEKNIYFKILHPTDNEITENKINNNALVAKFVYNKFSILFTGDIEEIAEKEILKRYKGTNELQANVLKVAHHGSKTSSTQEFLEAVQPQIALIGVGKNNSYGHPNEDVINRLENLRSKNKKNRFRGRNRIIKLKLYIKCKLKKFYKIKS